MQWLNVKEFPVLVIGYENLVKDTYTELKRMLDFIGYPYNEDDVLCAVKNSGGSFHRNHTKKRVNPYSPQLQEIVLNQIKKIDAELLEHNISLYHPYTIWYKTEARISSYIAIYTKLHNTVKNYIVILIAS